MAEFEFDPSDFLDKLASKEEKAVSIGVPAVQDSLDDLERISSNIAPLDTSLLRKSSTKKVSTTDKGIEGELSFSAVEQSGNGNFNYAYWTHEMEYKLGPKSRGGTDGYEVGNKYIERPLKGESEKYVKHWAEMISKGLMG